MASLQATAHNSQIGLYTANAACVYVEVIRPAGQWHSLRAA